MSQPNPLARCAAALALLAGPTAGWATEPAVGFGSAFRPQAVDAPTGAAAVNDGLSGLRIVVTGKKRPVASIDGRLVHVGDTVNGMRVEHIGAQEVVLVGEGGAKERLFVNPLVVNSKRPVPPARTDLGVRR